MYPLFGISYDPHSSFCVFSLYLKLLNCSIISFFDRGFSAGIHSLSLGTLYHILFAIDLLNSPSDLVFFFNKGNGYHLQKDFPSMWEHVRMLPSYEVKI